MRVPTSRARRRWPGPIAWPVPGSGPAVATPDQCTDRRHASPSNFPELHCDDGSRDQDPDANERLLPRSDVAVEMKDVKQQYRDRVEHDDCRDHDQQMPLERFARGKLSGGPRAQWLRRRRGQGTEGWK